MPTGNEPYTTYERGWMVRIRRPKNETESTGAQPPRILLLLHGWTGDENVMWIFTQNLPDNYWIFAPRGPVPAPEGGYGWLPHAEDKSWPALSDFNGIAEALVNALQHWAHQSHLLRAPFDVMGFSQGAAMAYALSAYYPDQVNRVVALAGFLPRDESIRNQYSVLRGKPVYIAHGTLDETVPVHFAQEAVHTLQDAGADVTYCESDVGHKLSAGCLRGLKEFLG